MHGLSLDSSHSHAILKSMKNVELKEKALALPPEERAELGGALLESIYLPLTKGQEAQLDDAIEAYKSNPDDVYSAEDVHRDIRERLQKK